VIEEIEKPFMQDQWYRTWVVVKNSNVYVTVDLEVSPDMPRFAFEDSTLVLSSEDHIFKQGQVGFFTNDTQSAFFDRIYIEPIDCQNNNPVESKVPIVPVDSNRFFENYSGGPLKNRWL